MSARATLVATLSSLQECLIEASLVDQAPTQIAHNKRAALLRQGLAVLTFTAVETFIRDRTAEVLGSLSTAALTFSDLSPLLQKAVTLGAFEGVRFKLKQQAAASRITWLVSNLGAIAGATANIGQLSPLAFGHDASNLQEEHVKEVLKAFGVENPWLQMTHLSSRVGVALPSAETEFVAIKERRHASAHALSANVPHADLESSISSALSICVSFDLLLSHSVGLHNSGTVPGVNGAASLTGADVKLLFIERRRDGRFGVRKEQSPPPAPRLARPTLKTFPAEVEAVAYAQPYAASRRMQVVALGASSRPTSWSTW